MKKFILLSAMASTSVLGQVPDIDIKGFNFLYNDPAGTGTASSFSMGASKVMDDGLTVDVEKIVQDFKIQVKGAETREFHLKNAPAFMQNARTIELKDFNANISNQVSLSLSYGKFESAESNLLLQDFSLACDKAVSQGAGVFIQGCIQQMVLKSSKFFSDSNETNKNIHAVFASSLVSATNNKNLTIKAITLKSTNGKFDLSADIKGQISGTAKGHGNLSYDEATQVVTIKISEVKFGILNVTTQVFDELKKQESAKLKVSKPYVYYSLK